MFCPPWSPWEGLSSLNLHQSSHLRCCNLGRHYQLDCLVWLRYVLCGLLLLREDDLLLEVCLVYGVIGLLLLVTVCGVNGSGSCGGQACVSVLCFCPCCCVCLCWGVLSDLYFCLSGVSLHWICSGFSCHHVDLRGVGGTMVISHHCDGSLVGWMSLTVVSYPNSVCRCDHVDCIHRILCMGR